MNKNKFLKELEKKLAILSEVERKDIVNEYTDIIEEKVRHGKTENEAVKEFGNFDDLIKEILTAYKIDPEYGNNKKHNTGNFEDQIEKGAKKLTEWTEGIANNIKTNNKNMTLEDIFKVAIKIIILLFLLMLLRIPFYIVSGLGLSFIDLGFMPFDNIFMWIWKVMVSLIYVALCFFVIFAFASKIISIKKEDKTVGKVKQKKTIKKQEIINEENTDSKKVIKNENKTKDIETSTICSVFVFIFKIVVIINILLPLFCVLFALLLVLSFIIFLAFKGLVIWGIIILSIGFTLFIYLIIKTIINLLNGIKKINVKSIMFNFVIIVVGFFLTINYFMTLNYNYHKDLSNFEISTYKINLESNNNLKIRNNEYMGELLYIVDENLEDNEINVEVSYYNEYFNENHFDYNYINGNLYFDYYIDIASLNNLFSSVIKDLEKNDLSDNYKELTLYNVKIYSNEATSKVIIKED